MEQSDKAEFSKAFLALGELYNREITPSLLGMYFEDLADYSIGAILSALRGHRRDPARGQYFPKPSDIIEKLQGGAREQAQQAWPEVIRLAANSRAAKSQNPITEAVVAQMGGWLRIGKTDHGQFEWLQKEFVERYQTLSKRPELAEAELNRLRGPVSILRLTTDE